MQVFFRAKWRSYRSSQGAWQSAPSSPCSKLVAQRGKKSGAVSPATRARFSIMPEVRPEMAAGITTEDGFGFGSAQRHGAFANRFTGTARRNSSVVRTAMGIIMMPSAVPPASAEKCFMGLTTKRIGHNADDNGGYAVQQVHHIANGKGERLARYIRLDRLPPKSRWGRQSRSPGAALCRCRRWHWPCRRRFRPRAWAAW
jgi:hypothetical protein